MTPINYTFKLSIVITTRNRSSDLVACLRSIEESTGLEFNYEIIVVDDASTDATATMSYKDFSINNLIFLRNSVQQMMVRTRNSGAKASRGELVLFIDDDNVLARDMISEIVRFADENAEYGIIGPKMCYFPSKRPYLSYQKINFFTGKTTGHLDASGAKYYDSDGIPNVFMVRKTALEDCGYFDESIVQTYTEPDLAFTASRLGYKCAMLQSAETYHRISEESSSVHLGGNKFNQKAFFLMRNRIVMIARYGRWYHQAVFLFLFSWLWPLLYTLSVIREKRFDLITLYWDGYWCGLKFFFSRNLPDSQRVIAKLVNGFERQKNKLGKRT
jgi:GT2 family glycosyltransferase